MTVSVFEPHHDMVSTPVAGAVEFSMQLVFSGLMAPFLTRTIPDLQPQVAEFASALKKQAERDSTRA